ncbi:MAG: hypothetical protein ACJA01_004051 [Saprospiraceae bacterium]|jgi:hypothetical protein
MNDLFNHIKSELDQPGDHPIDECVWHKVEAMPQKKLYVIPLWLAFLGVFASGFVGHWIWSSYSQVQQEVLPNELLDIEESGAVRTIYKHDTIYIPQYSNESFVLEKQLPNYSMTDFQKEIIKTNLLLKSSLLETQVDYKNLMLDYTYAQSKLSELRQQLNK